MLFLLIFNAYFREGAPFPVALEGCKPGLFFLIPWLVTLQSVFTYYVAARTVTLLVFYIVRARFRLFTGSLFELKYANIVHLTFTSFNSKEFVIS